MKRSLRHAFFAVLATVLAACHPIHGPGFYNATSRNLSVSMTFSSGYTWPDIPMPVSGFASYTEAEQVTAIEVREGGKLLFRLSGSALPPVPPDLSAPRKQMWEITDGGVCVLPERDFHGDAYPKCPAQQGGAAIS